MTFIIPLLYLKVMSCKWHLNPASVYVSNRLLTTLKGTSENEVFQTLKCMIPLNRCTSPP